MKKFIFFALGLLIAASHTRAVAQEPAEYSAQQLGVTFGQIVMSEFSRGDPAQDSSVWASRVQDYGREMAGMLLGGRVNSQNALEIIKECAPWYARALTRILKGTALNIYINDYIKALTSLFSEYKLDLHLQSDLVLLASSHLEKMNDLLNPSFYNYQ